MKLGEQGVPVMHRQLEDADGQALEEAKGIIARTQGVSPDKIPDDAVVEAYRVGGFSEWPPELAARVVRALGRTAGAVHV